MPGPGAWPLPAAAAVSRPRCERKLGEGPVLAFISRRPLNARQIGQLRHVAGQLRGPAAAASLVTGTADVVVTPERWCGPSAPPPGTCRSRTLVVPLALASRDVSPERELALRALVAAAYGATHLFTDEPEAPNVPTAIPVMSAGDWAYDRAAEAGARWP
mgnify:CR=1 FL=1